MEFKEERILETLYLFGSETAVVTLAYRYRWKNGVYMDLMDTDCKYDKYGNCLTTVSGTRLNLRVLLPDKSSLGLYESFTKHVQQYLGIIALLCFYIHVSLFLSKSLIQFVCS
jgi:hypothetical protein